MKKYLILTVLALAAAASCQKDSTLRYNNITMGDIVGENIISDQGNTFDIVENICAAELEALESTRVLFSCDVLRQTGENRYDIRLVDIVPVLTKEVVKESGITDPGSEMNVTDPINIRNIWYGGGYINIFFEFLMTEGNETPHIINLIHHDIETSETGLEPDSADYSFSIRHNAQGDLPGESDEYTVARGYASFPAAGVMKEDEASISISWNSYKFSDGGFSIAESEEVSRLYKWSRPAFEQEGSTTIRPNLKLYKYPSVR